MSAAPGEDSLKLAVKTFLMRGADRDVKLDRARSARLVEAIDSAIQEIVAERDGLIARVKKTISRPESESKRILARRDFPTTTPVSELRRAERRLKQLEKQIRDLETARAPFLQWAQSTALENAGD